MLFHVQPTSPVPIYEQIVTQVTYAVAAGDLKPGDALPWGVRDLAFQLTVNPNTVARAFQELERRGIITSQRGKRMAVTAEALSLCRDQRQDLVRDRIRAALREALSSGLPAAEVRRIVDEELAWAPGPKEHVRDDHFRGAR
jgi:GntR family transcriptional regulator